MIQLKVYKLAGDNDTALFLDLYDTEPIKLTLSIEDITNADASSVFSKTFRVPATRHNNDFFENAYAVDGIDFDVTKKNPAEILVDGAEFREGHVRLQKIYTNQDLDRIDYELLFLGETRDFSSVIAEKTLCQINMTNFTWDDSAGNPYVTYSNADDFIGPFNFADITGSWNAFPQSASTTAGTADGDLLFPLIDHGNTYDTTTGDPQQGTISLGPIDAGVNSFTYPAGSLGQDRLKPMIRAKRIWDQIFEDVNYTYTSDFLNSDRFKQMYVSAFGNAEQVGMVIGQTTGTIFDSEEGSQGDNSFPGPMFNSTVVQNQSNAYNIGGSSNGSSFICPGTSTAGGSFYLMNASASMRLEVEQSNGPNLNISSRVQLVVVNGGAGGSINRVLASGNFTNSGGTSTLNWDSRNGNDVTAGERLQVIFDTNSSFVDYDIIEDCQWNCTAAPGDYYAPLDLDCEYKQIDYIKDVLTMFRLVMQPDNARPNNFIIEPWQDFIGSGTTFDWSDKLVENFDQVLEPLFNTQSATIEYSLSEDEDFINKFHFDNNKHPYGWLQFNSQNELLKGTRKVEVKGIAPTPIDQIVHGGGTHPEPQFILPSIVEVSGDTTSSNPARAQQLAIKPKTRFLFYSGLKSINSDWYLTNDGGNEQVQDKYPLVSPYEAFPILPSSLNLNFSNDTRYYIDPSPGTGYFDQGSTLFDEYWSRYVASLYNKFSRRLTAKFILNNVDLQYLTFDDVIFVNGKYYRPEKIIDAQVGAETEVTVQLITLNDQRPIWLEEPLTGFSVAVSNTSCVGQQGEIQITTNGTPDFAWELTQSGSTGVASPTGTAPFTFTIPAPVGVDTLLVTDSLGRTATIQVTVPASTAIPVSSTSVNTNPTVCTTTTTPGFSNILSVNSSIGDAFNNPCGFLPFDTVVTDTFSGWNPFGTYSLAGDPVLNNGPLSVRVTYTVTAKLTQIPTVAWSQFYPGIAQSANTTRVPTQIGSSFVTGWPSTAPALNTPFTYTVTNFPFTIGTTNYTTDFVILRNGLYCGGSGGGFSFFGETTAVTNLSIESNNLTIPCNGSINTTPTGGAGAPYTTIWSDGVTAEDRTGLCPGTYQYYSEDVNGCQSDVFTVTLACATPTRTYQLREHLNSCTQSSSAIYIASSTANLPINQTVTLNERAGCYFIQQESTDTPLYTIDALSVSCAACSGGSTPVSWKVENCVVPGQFKFVNITQAELNPGDVVDDAAGNCYVVVSQSTTTVDLTYINIYGTCTACANAQTTPTNYVVQDCNGFSGGISSSSVTLNIGDVIKVGTNCATVLAESQGTATSVIDASTIYADCDACQGIVPTVQRCHLLTNNGSVIATGVYVFNSTSFNWSCKPGTTISICAEIGTVTTTTGGVAITVSTGTCTHPKECTIPVLDCNSYLLSNDSGSGGSYSYTDCDGATQFGLLSSGDRITVCARPTPNVSGGLTIAAGVTTC